MADASQYPLFRVLKGRMLSNLIGLLNTHKRYGAITYLVIPNVATGPIPQKERVAGVFISKSYNYSFGGQDVIRVLCILFPLA